MPHFVSILGAVHTGDGTPSGRFARRVRLKLHTQAYAVLLDRW